MVENVRIVGVDSNQPVQVENTLGVKSLAIAEFTHALVHAGEIFTVSGIAAAVVDAASFELLINVPADKTLHVVLEGSATGDAKGYIYEGPTVSANGTAVIPTNRNRTSSGLADSLFYMTPTVTTTGDLLFSTYMPGGVKKTAGGSSGESFGEWILAPGLYLMRFTNSSGAAADMSAQMTFYEEDAE